MRHRDISSLSYSVFCCQLSVTIIAPIIGLWIEKYNESFLTAGAIFSSFMVTTIPLQFVGGILSDRVGRKMLIVLGLTVYSLSSLLFVIERSPLDLMLFRALQGIGAGLFFPSATAYIADVTEPSERGEVMSIYNACLGAGLALGPLIGGGLANFLGVHSPFILAGILLAFASILSMLMLRHTIVKQEKFKFTVVRECGTSLFIACLSAFLGLGVAGIMESVFSPHAILGLGISEFNVGLALTAMFIAYSLLQPQLKEFMKKVGEDMTITLGFALCSIGLLMLSLTFNFVIIVCSLIAIGIGLGSLVLGSMTKASKSSPSEEFHGTVMGIYHSSMYIGMGLLPIAAGIMSDIYSAPTTFVLTSCGLAIFTVALFYSSLKPK
ncbi:MAG: MFS transporter [Candidatus Nezhaarchaeales archaeon]